MGAQKGRATNLAALDQASLLDAIPHAVFVLDRKKTILHANMVAMESYGMDLDQIRGKRCHELLRFDSRCEEDCPFDDAVASKRLEAREHVFRSRSHNVTCTPIIDDGGDVESIIHVMTDLERSFNFDESAVDGKEEFFERIFRSSPDEVLYIDRWGKCVDVNDRIRDLFGIEPEEAIGKRITYFARYATLTVDGVLSLFRQILAGNNRRSVLEMECIHKDGHTFFAEMNVTRVFKEGKTEGLLVLLRDVTERHEARKQLAESERLFQQMLNTIPDMVTVIDRSYDIVFSNWNGFAAVPEERRVIPSKCFRTYRDLDAPCPDCRAYDVFRSGEAFHERIKLPEGLWIDLRVLPLHDEIGAVKYVVEWVSDITAMKEIEEAVLKSESRFRGLVESSSDLIWELDANKRYTYVSPQVESILGYTPEDLRGASLKDLFEEEDAEWMSGILDQSISQGHSSFALELHARSKKGEGVLLETSGVVVQDVSGVVTGFRGIDRDITRRRAEERERELLQEQLTQAQKMESIGRLAGGIAHDFNNLLTGITGNVELAMLDIDEKDPLRELLEEIDKAGDSAAALTRQLLAFSRKQMIEPRVLSINEVIERSHRMLTRLIGEDIEVNFQAADDLWLVRIDPGQVEQILVNLVVNAKDAMPDGGRLTLETSNVVIDEWTEGCVEKEAPSEFVRLSVSDTGSGMSDEVKARLFEPFFTTKEKGKGTGLGLATVYGAVKQNEGQVKVVSELGQGTRIEIFIPKVVAAEDQISAEIDVGMPEGTETIIVVEDETMVRKLASRVLRRLGYEVRAFANGKEALEALETMDDTVHLLLTDVIMPGLNGRVLSEKIRRLRPGIKVLFTSGYTDDAIAYHGVVEQGIRFLGKPYSPQSLARSVRSVLDRS